MHRRRFFRQPQLARTAGAVIGPAASLAPLAALEDVPSPPGDYALVRVSRRAMATTGYTELKEFQRIEVVVQ